MVEVVDQYAVALGGFGVRVAAEWADFWELDFFLCVGLRSWR